VLFPLRAWVRNKTADDGGTGEKMLVNNKDGNNQTLTLIHGDCLQVLPTLPTASVDFILTDPPYITRYKSRDGRSVTNDDNDRWLKPAFAQMHRVLKNDSFAVSFYGW